MIDIAAPQSCNSQWLRHCAFASSPQKRRNVTENELQSPETLKTLSIVPVISHSDRKRRRLDNVFIFLHKKFLKCSPPNCSNRLARVGRCQESEKIAKNHFSYSRGQSGWSDGSEFEWQINFVWNSKIKTCCGDFRFHSRVKAHWHDLAPNESLWQSPKQHHMCVW